MRSAPALIIRIILLLSLCIILQRRYLTQHGLLPYLNYVPT